VLADVRVSELLRAAMVEKVAAVRKAEAARTEQEAAEVARQQRIENMRRNGK
jgi:hypothetical protein